MGEEIAIELARLQREAELAVRKRISDQQLGEAFYAETYREAA